MKLFTVITTLLAAIGALNWGLVGLFDTNLVHTLFGAVPALEKLIYILVGLSGLGLLATLPAAYKCHHPR